LPGFDEDRQAPAPADSPGLLPGAQALTDDRGFGRVGGDHPGAPGGGTAVPPQAGFDVAFIERDTLAG
jgi:hypothetical protein